jgi:hypothetical protein
VSVLNRSPEEEGSWPEMTLLVTREDFIGFRHRESFKSHVSYNKFFNRQVVGVVTELPTE